MISRKYLLLIVLGLAFFSGFLVHYLHRTARREYSDFRVYYKAGQDIARHKDIYRRETLAVTPFKYSPFFALCFVPLSFLPLSAAAGCFLVVNFILTIVLFKLSYDLAMDAGVFPAFAQKERFWIYAISVFCMLRCVFLVWQSGQVTILMDVLALSAVALALKDKPMAAGACLAAAILIKYVPVLLVPFFLFIRRPKVVLWTAAFGLVFLMLPCLWVGFGKNLTYLKEWVPWIIQTSINQGTYIDYKNQSMFSMVLRYLTPTYYNIHFMSLSFNMGMRVAYIFGFLLYTAAFFRLRRSPLSMMAGVLMIMMCMALFNPNCWMANYVVLAPVFIFMAQYVSYTRGKDIFMNVSLILSILLITILSRDLVGLELERIGYIYSFVVIGVLVLFAAMFKMKNEYLCCR